MNKNAQSYLKIFQLFSCGLWLFNIFLGPFGRTTAFFQATTDSGIRVCRMSNKVLRAAIKISYYKNNNAFFTLKYAGSNAYIEKIGEWYGA